MCDKDVDENGIRLVVGQHHDNPGKSKTFYNPVMKICRELVLTALGAYVADKNCFVPTCLDAFGATGVAGLQWKHHFKADVHVSINELDPVAVASIKQNCERNGLHVTDVAADTCDLKSSSTSDSVEVVQGDANVLMHQRQFHFLHLDPFGSTVHFLDAAFRNVYNGGMLVLTSTDVAALYGKCPNVTERNYSAYTVKTDYMKELAVRIVLAAAARAAARCNKGLEVVCCAAVEHFVQVAVRVHRGAKIADASLAHIHRVLHCRLCEEWVVLPDTKSPLENPYSLIPCNCRADSSGKTAVELGPMWCGGLFRTDFLRRMLETANRLALSERVRMLLDLMITESVCYRQPASRELDRGGPMSKLGQNEGCHSNVETVHPLSNNIETSVQYKTAIESAHRCDKPLFNCEKDRTRDSKDINTKQGSDKLENVAHILSEGTASDSSKLCIKTNGENITIPTVNVTPSLLVDHENKEGCISVLPGGNGIPGECVSCSRPAEGVKRKASDDDVFGDVVKRVKSWRDYGEDDMPLFYYNVHRRKLKNVDIPKAPKLERLLHKAGFRASRTHFEPRGIRTDATQLQLTSILSEHCLQNPCT